MSEFEVKMGRPGVNLNDLSADDEKLVDSHGKLVVNGLPWSAAPTGLYLTIFGTYKNPPAIGLNGSVYAAFRNDFRLFIDAGEGKPRPPVDGWGISLELPSDLGKDEMKRQYLTEWITESTKEILRESKAVLPNAGLDDFAAWLYMSAEQCIHRTGL